MSQTRYAVLGMLTQGPQTGYDLKKMSERSLAHFWHESYGNLYPQLAALEREGLVSSRREERPGRPDATVYKLTARGRRALVEWLVLPAAPERVRSELQLKVFFGANVPVEQTIGQITDYRDQQEALRQTFAAIEERVRREDADDPEAPYWLITLRRGQLLVAARLKWCAESLEILQGMRETAAAR